MSSLLDGHDFEQIPGDSQGQGSLVYCSPWGCKELEMASSVNNNNNSAGLCLGAWEVNIITKYIHVLTCGIIILIHADRKRIK